MKCGACSARARKLQRATILLGPGKLKTGRVCAKCARLGWLFVMGEPDLTATKTNTRKRARSPLMAHVLGEQ